MQISPINNYQISQNQKNQANNTLNFEGINRVYVPQKVFKHPDYISACEKEVDKIINKRNLAFFLDKIKNFVLFRPAHIFGKRAILTGDEVLNIPEKKGYHGFCVVTGKEQEKFVKQLSIPNIYRVRNEMNFSDPGSCYEATEYILHGLLSEFNRMPKTTFKVKSLSELSSINLTK